MSDPYAGEAGVDAATYRLGTYLAIVAGAQFVVNLAGGGRLGLRVDFVNVLAIAAALALRNGRRWGRTALLALGLLGLFLLFGFLLASDIERATGRLVFACAGVYTALEVVALAYTIPEEGVALGLPEGWRPWATSPALHGVILVVGLVGLFL